MSLEIIYQKEANLDDENNFNFNFSKEQRRGKKVYQW